MVDDVYEPLARYRDEFRGRFAELTRERFRELAAAAGVDVEANRRQVASVRALECGLAGARSRRSAFGWLAGLGYAAAAACVAAVLMRGRVDGAAAAVVGAAALFIAVWATLRCARGGDEVRRLEGEVHAAREVAWGQMAALNDSYTWDIPVRLIEATVPRLAFDPFFTERRLEDLKRLFGWDDSFNDGKSVVFAQSGVVNGNPFAIGELLEMEWVDKVYEGSIQISWVEIERDSEGRPRSVRRHQTLSARVVRPAPAYSRRKLLVYGNDAAPDLEFTREPSKLSDPGDGFFARLRRRRALRRLERFSRNLEDESQYTMMSNREFEMLFDTRDRNDEVEYRLLFTALAQRQMLALLKDREVGYGDDFRFEKRRRINVVRARHLDDATIDTDPARFRDWDFDRAAETFQRFNEKYFKDVYFAFAPLLAVPLYQQTRSHEEIWKGVLSADPASFWEHEAIANYYGGDAFRHPDCVTESVLKTRLVSRADGESVVAVTAHGFRGEERVAYERVLGGDGRFHSVPVEWIEYLPVERTSTMRVREGGRPAADASAADASARWRRRIYSCLMRG